MAAPRKKSKAAKNRGLIGHGQIVDFLENSWATDRLAHAYLFLGPDGVGKAAVAMRFASRVLGMEQLERHPDFLLVKRGDDPKTGKPRKDIALEQIQRMVGWLALGSMAGGWKVVVLDGAEELNKESANAMLKSLEEPHPRTLLLLLASEDTVLPTIQSRCQKIVFARVPEKEIAAALEASGVANSQLIARLSAGCPGRAWKLADDEATLAELIERRDALLTALEGGLADRWLTLEADIPDRLPFNEASERARGTLDLLSEILHDALLAANGRGDQIIHLDARDRLEAWAAKGGNARLATALEALKDSQRLIDENVSGRVALGNLAAALA